MVISTRDYLSILASEVAVERAFSIGRDLLGDRKRLIHGDTTRLLMLLGSNSISVYEVE